jgi:alkylation response protein AidB-like acyl-CoA dehydrogenase
MDFAFTEEQTLLQDSLMRFVQKEYTFEKRLASQKSSEGYSRAVWAQLAEMGVLGLPFPEEYGGFGGGGAETLIVMQAMGNGLLVEPYLATVVIGGGLVQALGDPAQKRMLSQVAEGKLLLAFAHGEPRSRYALAQVETRAARDGKGWKLSGRKAVVLHGAQADRLIVSGRTAGATADEAGISLFVVDRSAAGMSVRDCRTIDGLRAAEVVLKDVRVGAEALLGAEGGAFPAIDLVSDAGAAALCAEAVGVMETLNARTLEYLKTRQQFGQPIGRFQVLQHRAADMFIQCELSRSIALLAAMKAASSDAGERRRAVSAAKAFIGRAGRFIGQAAIQLHGGMGVSDEVVASHYAKRLTMIDFWLGDTEHHVARFARAA